MIIKKLQNKISNQISFHQKKKKILSSINNKIRKKFTVSIKKDKKEPKD